MSFIPKNYKKDGGDTLVIGGKLEIKDGATFTGYPVLDNQSASTATTATGLKENFNSLIYELKAKGYMVKDNFTLSVSKIASIPDSSANYTVATANQAAVDSVTIADNVITIKVDPDDLTAYTSSVAGEHKFVGIEITTGLSDITDIKYNGQALSAADVAEATVFGGDPGDIIMWVKVDEVVLTPKTFTLSAETYSETEFTVVVEVPEAE